MGLREMLRRKSNFAKIVLALIIVSSLGAIYFELTASHPQEAAVMQKAFYSADDGRTWFVDDAFKSSPCDHDGKRAYRALIYRCSGGKPFLAYLAKYSDRQQSELEADKVRFNGKPSLMVLTTPMQDLKKPGAAGWIHGSFSAVNGYPPPKCPSGSDAAIMVSPDEPDSGATNQ